MANYVAMRDEVVEKFLPKYESQIEQLANINSNLRNHTDAVDDYWIGDDADAFKGAQGRISKAIDDLIKASTEENMRITNKHKDMLKVRELGVTTFNKIGM